DLSPCRSPARKRRFSVRERDRGRQARAADQLLLPQSRRGDVRGVPAADDRHGLQELPDDRARRDGVGQDQLPLPHPAL
ncbi:MAG: DNA-directed RNA polymerase omega subunit, partial [uncultured Solirubrobacteraceae bacterium]